MVVLTGASSNHRRRLRSLADQPLRPDCAESAPLATHRQQQRRLCPDEIAQLVGEYQSGDDMNIIAARWGVHRTTVASHLRQSGVPLRRLGMSPDLVHEACRLYEEGWSLQRLAERYDCDAKTVRAALMREGLCLRAPWERSS